MVIKNIVQKLVRWQTIRIGSKQQKIPIPTFLGALLLFYLGYSLFRLFSIGEWRTFTSDHYGYSITYPAHWEKRGEYVPGIGRKSLNDLNVEFINGDALLLPSTISVKIYHRKIPEGSLEDVVKWGLEIKEIPDSAASASSLECILIGVQPYYALISTSYVRGFFLPYIKAIYVLSGEDAYILQLTTSSRKWNSASNTFSQMLSSFRLPDGSNQLSEQQCQLAD